MKKIFSFVLVLYVFSFGIEQKQCTYKYFASLSGGYLTPIGDVKNLFKSASTFQVNLNYRLTKKILAFGEFTIGSFPPVFKHENFGYEQDRRLYNFSTGLGFYLWQSKNPLVYHYYYLLEPQSGLIFYTDIGYYYHALIFRILQIRRDLWEEGDINFARYGFGFAPSLYFYKIFDFGFGYPVGIGIKLRYNFVNTKPLHSSYYYFDGEDFTKIRTPYPNSLNENYFQINLYFSIFNINF